MANKNSDPELQTWTQLLRYMQTDLVEPMREQLQELREYRAAQEEQTRSHLSRIAALEQRPLHVTCFSREAIDGLIKTSESHAVQIASIVKLRAWAVTSALAVVLSVGSMIWYVAQRDQTIQQTSDRVVAMELQLAEQAKQRRLGLIDVSTLSQEEREDLNELLSRANHKVAPAPPEVTP